MGRIAIIGAGISGLICGQLLSRNHEVEVFESSHAIGGRLRDHTLQTYKFDQGAQFFAAKTDIFCQYLSNLIKAKIVRNWNASFCQIQNKKSSNHRVWGTGTHLHIIGNPTLSGMCEYIAKDLKLRMDFSVARAYKKDKKMYIESKKGSYVGPFDLVILAGIPVASLHHDFLPKCTCSLRLLRSNCLPCYVLTVSHKSRVKHIASCSLIKGHDISLVINNDDKYMYKDHHSTTILATNSYAEKCIDICDHDIKEHMLEELRKATGVEITDPIQSNLSFWPNANKRYEKTARFHICENCKIGLCGDWLVRGNIENAFHSAHDLAIHIDSNQLS